MNPLSYLLVLALTIAVEVVVAWGLAGRGARRHVVLTCIAVNMVTHPLAMLAVLYTQAGLLVEVPVFLAEWLGYQTVAGLGPGRALTLALCANVLTTFLGFVAFV